MKSLRAKSHCERSEAISRHCDLDCFSPSGFAMTENSRFTANNRVVFNIKGNDYRLVVMVRYDKGLMFVKFVGTHSQYDKIDAVTV